MEITKGMKVYLKPVNNATRYGNAEVLEETVLKVGRKYFFVGQEGESERFWRKFNLSDWKEVSIYAPDYELYLSKQEILDEAEGKKLKAEIDTAFGMWSTRTFTLDQLQRIKAIIDEKGEE